MVDMTGPTDFRKRLYDRYVSEFKGAEVAYSAAGERNWRTWADRRLRPFLADLPRSSRVLELGCGPGWMLAYLRDLGFGSVEGIDISQEQVDLATSRGVSARVADVFRTLEESPNAYDLVIAIDFVEHFSKDELSRLVPLVRSALRPGGAFVVQTPNGEGLFPRQIIYGDFTHLTILTPNSLEQLFRIHGFDRFEF